MSVKMETKISDLKESLRLAEMMASMSLSKTNQSKTNNFFKRSFGVTKEDNKTEARPYVPPKQLLLYLVRMGSFTSRPQMEAKEYHDETVYIPSEMEDKFLLDWVKEQQKDAPSLLKRNYRPADDGQSRTTTDLSTPFRLLQWNILAQTLGTHADSFIRCPQKALDWDVRRFRILEEILAYDPDIVCLQEVDHFKFFQRALATQGYLGFFVPKPDSPCIYLPDNNGPDGCAIFFRSDRFELQEINTRILEVWKVQSNQVAIMAILRDVTSNRELVVLTTHLKARQGALLASLRQEQGLDLLSFLEEHRQGRPAIVCGDFNADPSEPVYAKITSDPESKLSSAYATLNGGTEPPYSTWKIRSDGESKHNIDYIFYTDDKITVAGGLDVPTEEEIGPSRVPSLAYPSDHFSLIGDFYLNAKKPSTMKEELRGRQ